MRGTLGPISDHLYHYLGSYIDFQLYI